MSGNLFDNIPDLPGCKIGGTSHVLGLRMGWRNYYDPESTFGGAFADDGRNIEGAIANIPYLKLKLDPGTNANRAFDRGDDDLGLWMNTREAVGGRFLARRQWKQIE